MSSFFGTGALFIGEPVLSGTPGSVLFIDASGNIGQDNPNFFYDKTNNNLGVGTNDPDVDAKLTLDKQIIAYVPDPTGAFVEDGGASDLPTYTEGDILQYRIYAYEVHDAVTVVSQSYTEASYLEISYPMQQAYFSWNGSADATGGYIILRDLNDDGYASYTIVNYTFNTFTDDNNAHGTIWTTGAPTLTPTSYLTPDPYFYHYNDGTDEFGAYGGAGYFETGDATATLANAAGYGGIFQAATGGNTIPAAIFIKDNAGLGTNNDIEVGRSGIVIHNPNDSAQTQMTFTKGAGYTVIGGVRADHPGNFNWEALANHYFWVSGLGTENIGMGISTVGLRIKSSSNATSQLHLGQGTTAASTSPMKFISGALMTAAEAGAVEHLTNDLYFTQTTNTSRHIVAWQDNPIPQQVFS